MPEAAPGVSCSGRGARGRDGRGKGEGWLGKEQLSPELGNPPVSGRLKLRESAGVRHPGRCGGREERASATSQEDPAEIFKLKPGSGEASGAEPAGEPDWRRAAGQSTALLGPGRTRGDAAAPAAPAPLGFQCRELHGWFQLAEGSQRDP